MSKPAARHTPKRTAEQPFQYPLARDYLEPDWQEEFWGGNYQRLLQIKRKYDPEDLFVCHHCVGSERWSSDGMCRTP